MWGFLFALIAGAVMSIQGVLNTGLSSRIGLLESNALVQGSAFAVAAVVTLLFGKGDLALIRSADRVTLWGGVLGVVITVAVMVAMQHLSTSVAVSAILVAQLATAAAIDSFGWFGAEKKPFTWNVLVGLGLLIGGILLMKANFSKT